MRPFPTLSLLVPAVLAIGAVEASAQSRLIDLGTKEGVESVRGEWRFLPAKVVEIEFKGPDGRPNTTNDVLPHAEGVDFDDSGWEVLDPTTLGQRRGAGKVCFAWYRIRVTLPEGVEGKTVRFQTRVDDYGEVWVDGKLPYKVGQNGGAIVAGFNALNIVELPDPAPGKSYQIAIFGINGPISVSPTNYIFLRDTALTISDE